MLRQARLLFFILGVVLAPDAFGARSSVRDAADLVPNPDTIPLVFIPGTTGTMLRESGGGRIRWGNTRSLLFPRDRGYLLALPLDRSGAERGLEPAGPILRLRLGPYRKPIYQPLFDSLARAGYVRGDLADPGPRQSLFVFSYDWRLDHVGNAARLARDLENLMRVRDSGNLRIYLVAQSGGAHLARYFLKYAGAPLRVAERGAGGPPARIKVDKLILVGTANGGGLRTLRDLNRGRRYVPLGRRFAPEVLFSFPALLQDLPVYSAELFVDPTGAPLDVDLFDADQWRKYQWSIYQPKVAARLGRLKGGNPFGELAARERYLRAQLDRARRFHRLLQADVPGFGATAYYSLQNRADPTPAQAVISGETGRWKTHFGGDRGLGSRSKAPGLTAPGDGHAVLASQQWLSPQEQAALARESQYFEGGHFEIIVKPELHQKLLEFLQD